MDHKDTGSVLSPAFSDVEMKQFLTLLDKLNTQLCNITTETKEVNNNGTKNDFSTIMTGRRSVRVYDETYKIPHEEMLEMIKEATTAPSSVNMQPWRFVVAESEEAKEILRPLIRFNTRQNDTSSAMVMILAICNVTNMAKKSITKLTNQGRCQKKSEINN